MPKARVEKILSDDGTTRVVEVEVGERGVTKTATYSVPANAAAFAKLILSLSDKPDAGAFHKSVLPMREKPDESESPLEFAYRLYTSSVDRASRALVYESIASESTEITVGKEKVDIMTFSLKRLIKAANSMLGQREIRLEVMHAPEQDAIDTEPDAAKKAEMVAKLEEITKTVDRSIGFGPWATVIKNVTKGYEDKDGNQVAPQAKFGAGGVLEPIV